MLLIDGVEYRQYKFAREEEIETLVELNAKKIFGINSLYIPVKTKIKSPSGIGSIPDGYAVSLSKPYKWYLVEAELSSHPLYEHIVSQLTRFINGFRSADSKKSLTRTLYDYLISDPVQEAWVKKQLGSSEVYKFVNDLMDNEPEIVIIIDEKNGELEEALGGLSLGEKHIIELKAYERVENGLRNVVLFDSLISQITQKPPQKTPPPKGPILNQKEYAIPILESLIEMGGSGKVQKIFEKVFEKVKNKLQEADFENVQSGKVVRWKNQAAWERQRLKQEGLLKENSPAGIWEISEKGREYVKSVKKV
jgi:hypothetical protein